MTFKQTKDLLDQIEHFHRQLADFYQSLKRKSRKKRINIMLEFMADKEHRFAQILADYRDKSSQKTLQSWFQYTPEKSLDDLVNSIKSCDTDSTVNLITLTAKFNDFLIDYFQQIARMARNKHDKEIFYRLIDIKQQEKIDFATNAQIFSDI